MILNSLDSLVCRSFHHATEEKNKHNNMSCYSGSIEGSARLLSWTRTYIWSLHIGKILNNGRRISACFLIYSLNVCQYEALITGVSYPTEVKNINPILYMPNNIVRRVMFNTKILPCECLHSVRLKGQPTAI